MDAYLYTSEYGQAHHSVGLHLRTPYSRNRLPAHTGYSLGTDDFAAGSLYTYLLDDPDFRWFIQNVRRRSENSTYELLRFDVRGSGGRQVRLAPF